MHNATYIVFILDERTWKSIQGNGEEAKRSWKGKDGGIGNVREGNYFKFSQTVERHIIFLSHWL